MPLLGRQILKAELKKMFMGEDEKTKQIGINGEVFMLREVSHNEQYEFVWNKDSNRRAFIEYRDAIFFSCRFSGVNKIYDLDDWEFLNELSAIIIKRGRK